MDTLALACHMDTLALASHMDTLALACGALLFAIPWNLADEKKRQLLHTLTKVAREYRNSLEVTLASYGMWRGGPLPHYCVLGMTFSCTSLARLMMDLMMS